MFCLLILSRLTAAGCRRSDPLCSACAKWRNPWWVEGPGLRLRVPEVDSKYLSSDHSDEPHHQVLYPCTAAVWWSYLYAA
jgi:hypothetical protein